MRSAAQWWAVVAILLAAIIGHSRVGEAAAPPAGGTTDAFEKPYREIGYTSVEEARTACEHYFGKPLRLPRIQPPAAFTHRLGRCSAASELNARLEVEYLHQNKGGNHFNIDVLPARDQIPNVLYRRNLIRTVRLEDGSTAAYGTTGPLPNFNLLVFRKGNWQYIFGVDRRIADQLPLEKLVDMANSIE